MDTLDVRGEWEEKNRICLRNRLLGLYLSSLKIQGRLNNTEDVVDFNKTFRPWMRTLRSLELSV
jgi:hypothetical protein